MKICKFFWQKCIANFKGTVPNDTHCSNSSSLQSCGALFCVRSLGTGASLSLSECMFVCVSTWMWHRRCTYWVTLRPTSHIKTNVYNDDVDDDDDADDNRGKRRISNPIVCKWYASLGRCVCLFRYFVSNHPRKWNYSRSHSLLCWFRASTYTIHSTMRQNTSDRAAYMTDRLYIGAIRISFFCIFRSSWSLSFCPFIGRFYLGDFRIESFVYAVLCVQSERGSLDTHTHTRRVWGQKPRESGRVLHCIYIWAADWNAAEPATGQEWVASRESEYPVLCKLHTQHHNFLYMRWFFFCFGTGFLFFVCLTATTS